MATLRPRALIPTLCSLSLGACTAEREEPRTRPPDAVTGRPDCGADTREDSLQLPAWELRVALEDWDELHADPLADVEVDASLCASGRSYPIELELQGASSRHAAKKSFKLKFNRGQRLDGALLGDGEGSEGYAEIALKAMALDQSLIREALAFDLWREMGYDAPRTGFANLRINGEYWGLYVYVEPVDEAYLAGRGYPPNGRLYKATREHGSFADFAPGRDLRAAFEHKSGSAPPYEDLEALVTALQETPLEEQAFLDEIDPIFPIERYFDRMTWVSFTQNGDATAQNFFLYNVPRDGHDFWFQLPWDANLCFSASWRDPDEVNPPEGSLLIDGRNHFGSRLLKIQPLRDRYVARFLDVIDNVLTDDVVYATYQRHARRVEHDLAIDQERWQRAASPATAFAVLETFMAERPGILREKLAELAPAAAQMRGADGGDESDRDHGAETEPDR
jgi:spore coat protein CotH